jgi:hypothetical protein
MVKRILAGVFVVVVLVVGGLVVFARPLMMASFEPDQPFEASDLPAPQDYASESGWAALPTMTDNADLVPEGIPTPSGDPLADVFFIHPTTYIGSDRWNAPLDEPLAKEILEQFVLSSQASAFNECCRVFAPRYRQASFGSQIFGPDELPALNAAYEDVKQAFRHFIERFNEGRPFIVAAHSQGSIHGARLVMELVDGTPLRERLVAAYLIGMPVPSEAFQSIVPCPDATATGCFVSWQTWREGVDPSLIPLIPPAISVAGYHRPAAPPLGLCVNPLSWRTDGETAPSSENRGAVLTDEDPTLGMFITKKPGGIRVQRLPAPFNPGVSARCADGVLFLSNPTEKRFNRPNLIGPQGDYHIFDYAFFYMNLRENATARVKAFLASRAASQ